MPGFRIRSFVLPLLQIFAAIFFFLSFFFLLFLECLQCAVSSWYLRLQCGVAADRHGAGESTPNLVGGEKKTMRITRESG
jgi:hypothetical protein